MLIKYLSLVFMLILTITLISCDQQTGDNALSAKEKEDGWQLLFDGKTTNGWHLYNGTKQAPMVWIVEDGALVCSPRPGVERGDLATDKSFENFELKFDWKMAADGNSGVFLNVLERADIPTAWASGPEYQLLGAAHHDYDKELKRAGCLYGFQPQLTPVDVVPPDQWNNGVIKQQNGKVEFYLNGKITAREDFTTQQWRDTVANTGFKGFPEFGKYTSGKIALQDWNKGVAFKNIKIKSCRY
ncbi:DUF1080 domain-containing protein [Chitinophaga horti]|uniref:DUF1080 domain-containing protein n=1 Tax=Chitinophaga horti TaxID=2920382 RepID=A0ABY6J406_9BACT|nr:DUF1080 domain-containing protein [Chitinophaga horti]UYQ94400.1 DUF1080 domain-containing protein [Chitinophaga horti]